MANANKHKKPWFLYGVVGVLLAAPNGIFIKLGTNQLDPFVFNALRHIIVAVLATPFIWQARRLFTLKSATLSLVFGLLMSVAVVCYAKAIQLSNASYPSVIMLLSPIVFIVFSTMMTRDTVNRRQLAGITLAALGAFLIIGLPFVLSQQDSFRFYPTATLYMLGNVITFPLAIVFSKKAHQKKLPLKAIMGISFWVVCIVNALFAGNKLTSLNVFSLSPIAIVAVLYSGLVVAFIARDLNIRSYEHLGSGVSSALGYAETLLSVYLPLLILGETLSTELFIGGALILLGVYIAEHHDSSHHRYFHLFRGH